jgi:GNAT superfamily N-acetyltransferase
MRADVEIRPLHEDDLARVHEVNMAAFIALDPDEPRPLPDPERAQIRLRRILASDPGGCWVAVRDGDVAGCALAIVRDGVWGLSLLFVDPAVQSGGVGRELLARAYAYGNGARGWIILSSEDPRALRAYRRLGLTLDPCVAAEGRPEVAAPPEVRIGTAEDLPLTIAVDRAARGAAHGEDILAMLEAGLTMLVAPGGGYAMVREDRVYLLAAFDDAAARTVLHGALAHLAGTGRENVHVEWLTARQQWAIDACLDAGLRLHAHDGAVFTAGDVGPLRPYIPSGAYL